VQLRLVPIAGVAGAVLISLGTIRTDAGRAALDMTIQQMSTAARAWTAGVPVAENVLIISIDGLRADAIERYQPSVLTRLVQEGATARDARTVSPSRTLPAHTSMLTGVPPEVHGITWNEDRTAERGTVKAVTVFELAKAAGYTTALFVSKPKLKHLLKPGTLDYAAAPSGSTNLRATETVEAATRYIQRRRPNLVFVHIAEPDYAGHSVGWMSAAYGWAVRRADAAVGQLQAVAERAYGTGGYSLIITADHGGHDRTHGTNRVEDMRIPWIAWGAGVQPGVVAARVTTMDTGATVLWLLGIDIPVAWTGRPVTAAYADAARHLTR
jgi:predicted AlkP superfamily pyrophosphatase or phosphodiesterase